MRYLVALGLLVLAGCVTVTPADRAAGYAAEAKGVDALCKAYRFDRAMGLTPDVPRMSELCEK